MSSKLETDLILWWNSVVSKREMSCSFSRRSLCDILFSLTFTDDVEVPLKFHVRVLPPIFPFLILPFVACVDLQWE